MGGSLLPAPVRERLLLLMGILGDLAQTGREKVTSRDLARWLGTTPATVRKDLTWIGPASSGAAYAVDLLLQRLKEVLEPKRPWKTAIAGLGDWGLALWGELQTSALGLFEIKAGYDSRTNRLETLSLPFPLFPTTEIVGSSLRLGLEAALIAVPAPEAQRTADRFIQGGVRFLINYSPTILRVNRHQIRVRECGLTLDPLFTPSGEP